MGESFTLSDSWVLPLLGLIFGLSCLGGVGLVVFALFMRGRQRESCSAWAARRGMSFEAESPRTALGEPDPRLAAVGSFPLFQPVSDMSRPHMWNVAHGVIGGSEVWVFEYSDDYDTESQKLDVACFRDPGLDLPVFTLAARFRLLGVSLPNLNRGQESPDLPLGDAAFDANYALHGPEEARVRKTFRPAVVEFFAQRPDWTVQGDGDRLLVTRFRLRWDEVADEGRRLLELFRTPA